MKRIAISTCRLLAGFMLVVLSYGNITAQNSDDAANAVEFTVDNITYRGYISDKGKPEAEVTGLVNGEITSLTVPASVEYENVDYAVTSIGYRAFYKNKVLLEATFPESLVSIGDDAFRECSNLHKVSLPPNLIHIGNYSFDDCESLAEIDLPESMVSVGEWAFSGCEKLRNVMFPKSLSYLGADSFNYCKGLVSVDMSETEIETIEHGTFFFCPSLEEVKFPKKLKTIETSAFFMVSYEPPLSTLYIPSTVESIGDDAFAGLGNLTSLIVDENNRNYSSIGGMLLNKDQTYLIAYPGAKGNAVVPEGVKKIGGGAFQKVEEPKNALISITFPSTLEDISNDIFCFYNCMELRRIICYAQTPPVGTSFLYIDNFAGEDNNDVKFYVPASSLEQYKQAPYWRAVKDVIFPIEDTSVGTVEDSSFEETEADVYTPDGRLVGTKVPITDIRSIYPSGLYILKGTTSSSKILVK